MAWATTKARSLTPGGQRTLDDYGVGGAAPGDHDGGSGQAADRRKGRLSVAVERRSTRLARRGAPRYWQAQIPYLYTHRRRRAASPQVPIIPTITFVLVFTFVFLLIANA